MGTKLTAPQRDHLLRLRDAGGTHTKPGPDWSARVLRRLAELGLVRVVAGASRGRDQGDYTMITAEGLSALLEGEG